MPRIISYTPQWLQRPSPGYHMFAPHTATTKPSSATHEDTGRRKTIATRDSEIFVAVGNEIRWADLSMLKEGTGSYRTLKASIPLPITQLVVSPYGDYIAVSTSHTVHVVTLPDSALLEGSPKDTTPIKLRSFQIGPTAHVREESPVASVLWHPLGYRGRCLVTITREGVVRLWELNRTDRSTFSEPALSIDLKKLANATSDADPLGASIYGAPKGFSPDSFELEVASACFGDFPDQEGVHGWAPMTLWIAMVAGDLYALCPLLPKKWQLQESSGASTVVQTLATSINSSHAETEEDTQAPQIEVENAQKQLSWIYDILLGDPVEEKLPSGDSVKVFSRPSSVSAYPQLQGPFSIMPEVDDFEISDLIVFSLKTFSESSEEEPAEGLPAAVVCLLTDTSKVHICLDLEGVVGRWLPSFSDSHTPPPPIEHNLVVVETVALTNDETSSFSHSITTDTHTDFSFFVSHASGVFYLSLEPWIRRLEIELSEPQSERMEFRIERLFESANTRAELCMPRTDTHQEEYVTACVAIENGTVSSDVGYLVLTSVANEPQAVILDAPEDGATDEGRITQLLEAPAKTIQTRPTYQPPPELYQTPKFLSEIDRIIPARHKATLNSEIRLSPANLDILMNAHKMLSQDTHNLQQAVSGLFRRCERLRDEFRDQVFRAAQAANKIDYITGIDDVDSSEYGSAKIEERLDKVKARQDKINARYETIRKKMANVGGTELSEREAEFVDQLQTMDRTLDKEAQTLSDIVDGSEVPFWQRLESIKGMKKDLTKQVEEASHADKEDQPRQMSGGGVKVPSQLRKQENAVIEELLQHEVALIEAATSRLRSLGIAIPLEGSS